MQDQEKLDQMTQWIKDDCRCFGLGKAYIDSIEKDILITCCSNNDYYFYYDPEKGYVLTFWERGFCNWGMNSRDERGFRFLFLRHLILHDFMFMSVPEAEKFMSDAAALFGETQEYRDAEAWLNRRRKAAARGDGESRLRKAGRTEEE